MDGITAEMIKETETIVQWVCGLHKQIWDSSVVPEDWKDGTFI